MNDRYRCILDGQHNKFLSDSGVKAWREIQDKIEASNPKMSWTEIEYLCLREWHKVVRAEYWM